MEALIIILGAQSDPALGLEAFVGEAVPGDLNSESAATCYFRSHLLALFDTCPARLHASTVPPHRPPVDDTDPADTYCLF